MWCVRNQRNFKSCVNVDTNIDVSVYQGEVKQKSCGTLKLTYGLKQSDQIYTLVCGTEGDTVKLSKTTGAISAYEIVVTGKGDYELHDVFKIQSIRRLSAIFGLTILSIGLVLLEGFIVFGVANPALVTVMLFGILKNPINN